MDKRRRKPYVKVYNNIIDSFCKDKMVDEALAILQEIIEKGILPNVVTYGCLIHGPCILSRWEDVNKIFFEMKDYKIIPNVITFNIVVDALCKEGYIENAEEVVHIMIQQGQNPNLVKYSSLMDGYCLQKRIDDTRRVFDTMVASGLTPDLHSYGFLINAYYKTKKVKAAMNLFRQISHKGLTPDIVVYTIVLQGLLSSGRHVDEALQLFHAMEADGTNIYIEMYTIILDGLCKSRRLDIARDLFNNLSLKGLDPDVRTCTSMIAACFQKGGHYDDVMVYYEEMVRRGFSLDASTFSILLDSSAENQNNPSLLMLMLKIDPDCKKFMDREQRGPSHQLQHHDCCLLSEGLLIEAKELLKTMEAKGFLANDCTCNVILQGLLKGGHYDDVMVYYEEMVRRGFSLDASTFSILLDSSAENQNNPSLLMLMLKIDPDCKKFMDREQRGPSHQLQHVGPAIYFGR
nr:putative pentatricopeptide repeat-containing protein At1g12700, mitochondrial [Coffea arabica]